MSGSGAVKLLAGTAIVVGLLIAVVAIRHHGADRLRQIVQGQCVVHWLESHDPSPCVVVSLHNRASTAQGYAVLHDRKGGAHWLLIPTDSISGIEDAAIYAPGAVNYFAAAWEVRGLLAQTLGRAPRRDMIGLAINSARGRTQNQLHIHIECLRTSIHEALRAASARIGGTWSAIEVANRRYHALRIMGETLDGANAFELLADRLAGAKGAMGAYNLLVAGMDFKEGPGFVVLAGNAASGGGEALLDSSCALML